VSRNDIHAPIVQAEISLRRARQPASLAERAPSAIGARRNRDYLTLVMCPAFSRAKEHSSVPDV
jgi:hypothetical protein